MFGCLFLQADIYQFTEKQMKAIHGFAIAVAACALIACKKDKEAPSITINQPANHSEHTWGSEVHVEVVFSDDRELKSYRIHIGNEAGDPAPEFSVEFTGDLDGTSYDFHEHFVVPDAVESVYYLHFSVTDAEGKSATDKRMLHFME